jgi:hypothetical protein
MITEITPEGGTSLAEVANHRRNRPTIMIYCILYD